MKIDLYSGKQGRKLQALAHARGQAGDDQSPTAARLGPPARGDKPVPPFATPRVGRTRARNRPLTGTTPGHSRRAHSHLLEEGLVARAGQPASPNRSHLLEEGLVARAGQPASPNRLPGIQHPGRKGNARPIRTEAGNVLYVRRLRKGRLRLRDDRPSPVRRPGRPADQARQGDGRKSLPPAREAARRLERAGRPDDQRLRRAVEVRHPGIRRHEAKGRHLGNGRVDRRPDQQHGLYRTGAGLQQYRQRRLVGRRRLARRQRTRRRRPVLRTASPDPAGEERGSGQRHPGTGRLRRGLALQTHHARKRQLLRHPRNGRRRRPVDRQSEQPGRRRQLRLQGI